jgi:hypothetical protein
MYYELIYDFFRANKRDSRYQNLYQLVLPLKQRLELMHAYYLYSTRKNLDSGIFMDGLLLSRNLANTFRRSFFPLAVFDALQMYPDLRLSYATRCVIALSEPVLKKKKFEVRSLLKVQLVHQRTLTLDFPWNQSEFKKLKSNFLGQSMIIIDVIDANFPRTVMNNGELLTLSQLIDYYLNENFVFNLVSKVNRRDKNKQINGNLRTLFGILSTQQNAYTCKSRFFMSSLLKKQKLSQASYSRLRYYLIEQPLETLLTDADLDKIFNLLKKASQEKVKNSSNIRSILNEIAWMNKKK